MDQCACLKKNHGGANLTISMKNHMGIVWDRGYFHKNDLQQCIADICTMQKKAVLNVVDAYRIMKKPMVRVDALPQMLYWLKVFLSHLI